MFGFSLYFCTHDLKYSSTYKCTSASGKNISQFKALIEERENNKNIKHMSVIV